MADMEKIARAIDPFAWAEMSSRMEQDRQDSLRNARAAFAAIVEMMREPSRGMLNAMNMEVPTWDDDASRRKWRAGLEAFAKDCGLSAALAGGEK